MALLKVICWAPIIVIFNLFDMRMSYTSDITVNNALFGSSVYLACKSIYMQGLDREMANSSCFSTTLFLGCAKE